MKKMKIIWQLKGNLHIFLHTPSSSLSLSYCVDGSNELYELVVLELVDKCSIEAWNSRWSFNSLKWKWNSKNCDLLYDSVCTDFPTFSPVFVMKKVLFLTIRYYLKTQIESIEEKTRTKFSSFSWYCGNLTNCAQFSSDGKRFSALVSTTSIVLYSLSNRAFNGVNIF